MPADREQGEAAPGNGTLLSVRDLALRAQVERLRRQAGDPPRPPGGAGSPRDPADARTALAQVGEGKVLALFTLVGLVAGTYLYALLVEKHLKAEA